MKIIHTLDHLLSPKAAAIIALISLGYITGVTHLHLATVGASWHAAYEAAISAALWISIYTYIPYTIVCLILAAVFGISELLNACIKERD